MATAKKVPPKNVVAKAPVKRPPSNISVPVKKFVSRKIVTNKMVALKTPISKGLPLVKNPAAAKKGALSREKIVPAKALLPARKAVTSSPSKKATSKISAKKVVAQKAPAKKAPAKKAITKKTTSSPSAKSALTPAKTVLNPQAAWPFPVATKP